MAERLNSILKEAAEGHRIVPDDWMPASRLRPFMLDDPGVVWLEYHGEAHDLRPDFPSPYSFADFLAEKGKGLKETWIQKSTKGASRVCEESYHVRYANKLRKTLELMLVDSAPVIVEPALWWAPERIYGAPDLLVHTGWLRDHFPDRWQELVDQDEPGEEPEGYVIFELRFTARDRSLEIAEAQIRFNTYMLGHLQGWMPTRGFLIARGAVGLPQPIEIRSRLGQALDKDLREMRDQFLEIKLHGQDLLPWCDESVKVNLRRSDDLWHTAKALISWEETPGGDLCALPRVGATQAVELKERGFPSIHAMLQEKHLSDIPLEKIHGIGEPTAKLIRAVLQANRSGQPVLPADEAVPTAKDFEFFVDFEFFSNLNVDFRRDWPSLGGCPMIFMIGVGWEEHNAWQYRAFIAKRERIEDEGQMIEELIQFLKSWTGEAMNDPARMVVYHWYSVEPGEATKAADRHGLPLDHPFRHLPWLDLRERFMQTSCAMPGAWDYSLKSVAKALGRLDPGYDPQWVGDLDRGSDAMIIGWQAYRSKKKSESPEMQMLEQYLQADCKALWSVLRWMRAGEPGAVFGAEGQDYVGWDKVKKGFTRPGEEGAFAALNEGKGVFIYQQPVLEAKDGIKKVQHLIWGDWLRILERQGDWRKVLSRGTVGWLHRDFIQEEQLLEVNFIDVGQGDGCFIVTPDDNFLLIDAGEEDHMYRFLRWRFRHFEKSIRFQAAVISHPDLDHYAGFTKFFDPEDEAVQNVRFDCIYHNGILDAPSKKGLLLAEDEATLRAVLQELSSRNRYANLLRAALDSGRVGNICMLSAKGDGIDYLPGYGTGQTIEIEVLGPVPEGPVGAPRLRWFGTTGLTKNGHSIVLRLRYRNVRLLLGGDLNIPAEQYLLSHYGGINKPFAELTETEKNAMITRAQAFFGVDIAKSCHHGSADVSSEFLQAVDAVATVVSSGDNEPHCHPRPEALGLLGRFGRGDWPLIFSTELARSAKENVKHPYSLWRRHQAAVKEDRETEFIEELIQGLGRSVAVYGMITLRTDGEHVLIAQKLEQPGSGGRKWDLHLLSSDKSKQLYYESKHQH